MNKPPDTPALNPCPDCGHPCSPKAVTCPNCGRPFSQQNKSQKGGIDDSIFQHILNQSSTKVGMCLTLLGMVKIVEGVKSIKLVTDELLAVDALGFLLSSILTYGALKGADDERKQRTGRIADLVFTGSLLFLAVICGIIAMELL